MAYFELSPIIMLALACHLAGGAAGIFLARFAKRTGQAGTHLALTLAMAGGGLVAYLGACYWLDPMPEPVTIASLVRGLPSSFPTLRLELFADRLAAFFLLLIGMLSALVALYSFVWLKDKAQKNRIAGMYNLFVLAAWLMVIANDVYFFLAFLECMTLVFTFLTMYRHNLLLQQPSEQVDPEEMVAAERAFKVYPVFSHAGVILVTVALVLLALAAGDASFDALRDLSLEGKPGLANAVFLLALAGLGIKGGFSPAHPWVSIVHPYSPTTTHALTLGLIIKVSSFYMLIRILFEFLSPVAWWWGVLVLVVAGATALVGVFYAITSRDLKTALSNHSVENMGIILAGVGLALSLSSSEYNAWLGQDMFAAPPPLAGLALVAALYHLLNHTAFKSLLYLCTGAIENRTGTVDLEKLGGLVHRFPWTSITFLVGAVAIAGMPPLNGFVSEWLTLQAVFAGHNLVAMGQPWLAVSLIALLLMLGIAFGLTALAFAKITGEVLLGAPRRPEISASEKNGDVPWRMRATLLVLSIVCLCLGLFPGTVANQLAEIPHDLLKLEAPLSFGTSATTLEYDVSLQSVEGKEQPRPYQARLAMLPLLAGIGLPAVLGLVLSWRWRRLSGELWTGGAAYQPEAMQISGSAFSYMVWSWLEPRKEGKRPPVGEEVEQAGTSTASEWLPWRLNLSEGRRVREPFRQIIDAAVGWLITTSEQFGNWFQGGDIRRYLGYLFVTFIIMLLVAVLWQ